MSKWISVIIAGEELDEKCSLLFEFGIVGNSIAPDGTATCFVQSEDGSISPELKNEIERLNLSIKNIELIEEANWTQNCDELFETVQVGELKILPIRTFQEISCDPLINKKDIFIIPGTGFGTGHHATTFNLLKLLQHSEFISNPPATVLDAGTGSGILAIGAARLFNCAIDAYEVDPLAVENAQENVALNKLESRIKIYCESVHRCEATYDLVIANLYAELLEILCSHLVNRGNGKGHFLLSGIRADLTDGVINKYQAHGLRCMERITSEGWSALMFKYS